MILVGNQRGGGRDLARHLLKEENERVVVHEIRGFVADDLHGAFQESHAVSRGTRCKQHLYSLSLNPPQEADPTPELFEEAVNRAEERLGLKGQPRAIVFHEKTGRDGKLRRHAHAVWSRVDVQSMKAVQLSFDRKKLNALGRELYLEHGWTMPRGFVQHAERDPRNFSLEEWQQAKRAKKDPQALKTMFQDCWAISDGQAAFAHALQERGYILARGNRNGIVAVDHRGEVYAVRTYVGIKPKQVREKVKDAANLPNATIARNMAAARVQDRLKELQAGQTKAAMSVLRALVEQRRRAKQAQGHAARRLAAQQEQRQRVEEAQRQARIRTGWRGLIDRITGMRKRMLAENLAAAKEMLRRDRSERAAMGALQTAWRQQLLDKARAAKRQHKAVLRELSEDIQHLQPVRPPPDAGRDKEREAYVKKQRRETNRPRRGRSNNRDGPSRSL